MTAAVGGSRPAWADLPPAVRAAVEGVLGDRVVSAASQPGGFSPGTADRVVTAGGRRAFVKAVGAAQNPDSLALARRELHVTAGLPAHPALPRHLGGYDDGSWVALVLEDVAGRHPRTPWVAAEVDAVAAALRDLAAALTPAPVPGLPTAADTAGDDLAGWDRVAADPPGDLDPWAAAHLDELRAAGARAAAALGGGTVVHLDVRADNVLLRPDGSVVVVDWPWACTGPAWLDTALLAMNVVVHGGDADRLLTPAARDVLTGYAGFFVDGARRPPPPGVPAVRAFQRFQGAALTAWLRDAR